MELPGCETLIRNAFYRHHGVDIPGIDPDTAHVLHCIRYNDPLPSEVVDLLKTAAKEMDAIAHEVVPRTPFIIRDLKQYELPLLLLTPEARTALIAGELISAVEDPAAHPAHVVQVTHRIYPAKGFKPELSYLEAPAPRGRSIEGTGRVWHASFRFGEAFPLPDKLKMLIGETNESKTLSVYGHTGPWSDEILLESLEALAQGWGDLEDHSRRALEEQAAVMAQKIISRYGAQDPGTYISIPDVEPGMYGPN